MTGPQIAPYGSWRSPISADLIVGHSLRLANPQLDGEDAYWVEGRPAEGGRNVIVRRAGDGTLADVTPSGFNVRTRVHEYGGRCYLVSHGTIYFANFADQRIYRQAAGTAPEPITPQAGGEESGVLRYADLVLDAPRARLICIREDHRQPGREAVNSLVTVSLTGGDAGSPLAEGHDFYASPALSPDGSRLAWLSWDHPNMPWDGCELWVADVASDGGLLNPTLVAGGKEESIFEPSWSPDGRLYFVSDRTGWWNLYRRNADGQVGALHPLDAEFGLPQWTFGTGTYAFINAGRLLCTYAQDGTWHLAYLDLNSGRLEDVPAPLTEVSDPVAMGDRALFVAGSPTEARSIIRLDFAEDRTSVLRRSSDVTIAPGFLSLPRAITYPSGGGQTAHGIFYPPANRDFDAPAGERPPLLVMIHGGPTGAAYQTLNLAVQFWTSRGIAVLDVNYRGSTGYGRGYRERLKGNWGIADVEDCANGARYLSGEGLVDARRLAISGGSAGGFTTLAALTFTDAFSAGASHYGVTDLAALASDTHKFESRYLDGLVGPYPAARQIYEARSPIYHVDQLNRPVILLQGLEDRVVPPQQAETMFAAVAGKGVPVAYLPFAGEQHGFRRAENIKRALEAELYFYSRVFGFKPADAIEPVPIVNLPG
ncbi:MAG TPA: S9 family peptidase [Anaerolineae bacterium]